MRIVGSFLRGILITMRAPRQPLDTKRKRRKLVVAPLFALLKVRFVASVCLLLSVIWLGNNAALCIASTSARSASIAGSSGSAAPACRCLKCPMTGGKCCCATKATAQNPVCMRALCDGQDEALARAAWLPPTIPAAPLTACPPSTVPAAPASARQPDRLTARTVAPPAQPPRLSLVKKTRRFLS